jgi:hypothetical protein
MVSARSPRLRLQHILDNIDGILAATAGMTAAQVMQHQEDEGEAHLAAIRDRVRRSLADSRPDVPLAEAFDRLARHHARTL